MATITLKEKYECRDDCEQRGCPGHEAVLEYNTTADGGTLYDGKGNSISLDAGAMECLSLLLRKLFDLGY